MGRSLPAARVADRHGDTQHVPSIHLVQVDHSTGAQDGGTGFKAKVDAAVKAALADRRVDGGDTEQATCNNWDYTGTCSYGDRCKFSHDAEAGYNGTAQVKADKEEMELQELQEDKLFAGVYISAHLRSGARGRKSGMHAMGWQMDLQDAKYEN